MADPQKLNWIPILRVFNATPQIDGLKLQQSNLKTQQKLYKAEKHKHWLSNIVMIIQSSFGLI